jgi:hypothetical protein
MIRNVTAEPLREAGSSSSESALAEPTTNIADREPASEDVPQAADLIAVNEPDAECG